MYPATNKRTGRDRVYAPCPTQIDIHIAIVFGQTQQLVVIWIADVHANEAGIWERFDQWSYEPWRKPLEGHCPVTCVMARVNFDWYAEDPRLVGDNAQRPIAQDERIVCCQWDPCAVLFEGMLAGIVSDVRPCKGARIGVLGFYGDNVVCMHTQKRLQG